MVSHLSFYIVAFYYRCSSWVLFPLFVPLSFQAHMNHVSMLRRQR